MNSASNINCFELSSKIFDKVAYNVATDWSRLGRYLDLTNEEIAMIDSDYGKTHEKANQVLVKWRQKIGNVTWQQLKKNLESIERFDIIRQIEKDLIGILTRPGTIGGENTQLSIISGEKAQPAKSRVADKKSLLQNPGVDGIRNYKIPPYFYVHILDQNTNVARVEVGPQNYICHDNENYIFGPYPMVTIPTHHYCIIENPVIYYENVVDLDLNGQARIKYGELEVRFTQDPFPLYPGEVVKQSPIPFTVLEANTALHLRAAMLFSNNDGKKYVAGDEWLFEGPGTYIPRKEVDVIKKIHATIIKHNQAIKLRARRETKDRYGTKRVTGEEWLFRKMCAYLPDVFEEVIEVLDAYILTEKIALHMKATRTFFDDRFENKKKRKNGEEWLITSIDTENHIPNVYEQIVTIVNITTLNNRQYCVVCDPVDADGKPQLGFKKLVKGKKSFFLQPGESLENGIQNVFVLSEHESLILKATKKFIDDDNECAPGDIWMIQGPCEYVPPVEVEVCCVRKAITLDANEGVYVRNIKTGKVRAVIGCTYMLNQDEELWQKELPPVVEDLLSSGMNSLEDRSDRKWITEKLIARDKTKVVVYRVPYNAAVQIYDYKEKKSRIVFGSDVVMLEPHEQFTVLSISGGIPKQPNAIKALCLFLGPDFATDIVDVKTADHVQLSLQLSYNWNFDKSNGELLFSVPDFIGNACKTIASRIRGAVATLKFFDFHKNYAQIIRSAVFGLDDNKEVRKNYTFSLNNLNITSVDIHSVEAVTNILE